MLLRFSPIPVRPRTRHAMPEVLLALPPDLAGQTLEASWRVTSLSTRGDKPGTVEIEVVSPAGPDVLDVAYRGTQAW